MEKENDDTDRTDCGLAAGATDPQSLAGERASILDRSLSTEQS